MSIKVLAVLGTRPEAIKMSVLINHFKQSECVDCKVVVTAQHRQMLDQVLNFFKIIPDHDLNIMKPDQDLFDVTSRILFGLREVLVFERPDLVLVHGDTTTCFSASLAAFYLDIPVAHIEAGLRTLNLRSPFPEEANRALVARLATLHFAPTPLAKHNLVREGVDASNIWVTGNTVIDALLEVRAKLKNYDSSMLEKMFDRSLFEAIVNRSSKMILVTGHRRESFGEGFLNVCKALKKIAESKPEWLIVYPVHLNPNVQQPVYEILKGIDNVRLIAPLGYVPFVWLIDQCDLVITDSGGIQEEAPSLGKPVLVTRKVTERPEAVNAGTVKLVGTSLEDICFNAIEILTDDDLYNSMALAHNPYGDGDAVRRISETIMQVVK